MIKLSTSIYPEEWKSSFFEKGISKGAFSSQEYETELGRILVQSASHPFFHRKGRFVVVEFWKERSQVFRDPDAWEPGNSGWYGHYVNRIKPSEIIRVYLVRGKIEKNTCVLYTASGKRIY